MIYDGLGEVIYQPNKSLDNEPTRCYTAKLRETHMKPFQGIIHNWRLDQLNMDWVIAGVINDVAIYTSPIVRLDFENAIVETRNSIYLLRDPQ